VVPTARAPDTGLALSSRNAYLTVTERAFAPTLYAALRAAEARWDAGGTKRDCVAAATDVITAATRNAQAEGVRMELDYVEMNDAESFAVLSEDACKGSAEAGHNPVIVSGAVWVGKTRLIDNVLLSEDGKILIQK
jgi:pantoate--beta-alanine ligase